ncbi:reverse transcriptase domain-containing protein [Tanacetum coccineum]
MQSLSGKLAALNRSRNKLCSDREAGISASARSQKVKRYFQAHAIKVVADKPIKQILSSLETSGRLAKWALELGAYDISYASRSTIKGQGHPSNIGHHDQTRDVEVDTDGASSDHGSGAWLILIDLGEYEALLTELRIATKMKVKNVHAFVDSKFAASQVEASYEARGEKTKKYKEKGLELSS